MKSKLFSSFSLLVGLSLMLGSCLNNEIENPYQQLQEDVRDIDTYLLSNPPAPTDIVVRDASGIRLVITDKGPGVVPPTAYNVIQVAYVGRILKNGELSDPFEQTEEGDPYTFTLTNTDANGRDVILGWKYALYMMTEGTRARVYIPSLLAYGTTAKPAGASGIGIPKNSILVFDLELKLVNKDNEAVQHPKDVAKILTYFEENEITNYQGDPSGLYYVINSIGTGNAPGLYDHIKIRYTAKIMDANKTVFEDNLLREPSFSFSSRVVNYISNGKKIGLQKMYAGGKATFYVPSTLGFGPVTTGAVPPNSVLIYEVELLEVIPNGQAQ